MTGVDPAMDERILPLFEIFAVQVISIEPVGSGQVFKPWPRLGN